MNKKPLLFLIAVLLAVMMISGCETERHDVKNLPWQIIAEDDKKTVVFSLQVGKDSLLQVVEKLKKIPELAAFVSPDKTKLIEAYFSSVRVGVLQGSFAMEVDIKNVDLSAYARFEKGGKSMPSGKRRYQLSKTGILGANSLRVWKLAYLPSTNYTSEQIKQFFGQPETIKAMTKMIEYWYYPEKSLVVTYDKEGREIFYYSAKAEYDRLLKSLPSEAKDNK